MKEKKKKRNSLKGNIQRDKKTFEKLYLFVFSTVPGSD